MRKTLRTQLGGLLMILAGAATRCLWAAGTHCSPWAQENPYMGAMIAFLIAGNCLCLVTLLFELIESDSLVANAKAAAAILGLGISICFVQITSEWKSFEYLLWVIPSPYLGMLLEAKTSALVGVSGYMAGL